MRRVFPDFRTADNRHLHGSGGKSIRQIRCFYGNQRSAGSIANFEGIEFSLTFTREEIDGQWAADAVIQMLDFSENGTYAVHAVCSGKDIKVRGKSCVAGCHIKQSLAGSIG